MAPAHDQIVNKGTRTPEVTGKVASQVNSRQYAQSHQVRTQMAHQDCCQPQRPKIAEIVPRMDPGSQETQGQATAEIAHETQYHHGYESGPGARVFAGLGLFVP